MDLFYQGLIAGITMLGGLCAFIYWVFNITEKRLEIKIDALAGDINKIAQEVKLQGSRTDLLYQMFVEVQKESNQKFYDLLKEKSEGK